MNKILDLVIKTTEMICEEHEIEIIDDINEDTPLFGEILDSMGIVFLVTDLESVISEELNVYISLADERAMSQRTSPYRTVKTLAKYVQALVEEAKAE